MFVPLHNIAASVDVSEKKTSGSGKRDTCGLAAADPKLQDVLVDVASHYGGCSCVLALRRNEHLHVVAVNSQGHLVFEEKIPLIDEEKFQLFHHHIRRSLPTIIYDAADDKRLKDDPCVVGGAQVRFYAAAPVYSSNQECRGTLCIVANEPKSCFTLNEAEYLCVQATAIASLV
eukprot:TRINITY_DN4997_c0_g1_i3.p1 TRINITY_DN4997_c0_g1~~TRINITY_DN4997_c0_g1_i3.p1  ORF type:complete len:174 (-),score=32.04 TRINITY_DN4997_c0_g1_i3:31-552(-)